MSRLRKTITVLGLMAISVVVRCGDHDDDKDAEEDRRSMLMSSAYAEEASMSDENKPVSYQDLVNVR